MMMTLAIIFIRIFYLQVFDKQFAGVAENQAVKEIVNHPARGVLYDRNGLPILYNEIRYDLMIEPRVLLKQPFDTFAFCGYVDLDTQVFNKKMHRLILRNGYHVSSALLKELTIDEIIEFQNHLNEFPGVKLRERPVRINKYNVGGIFVGYLGEISSRMLENERYEGYKKGDYVGISGLENYYEEELRGVRGKRFVIRDSRGSIIGPYRDGSQDVEPIAGKDLELTIDIELQELAEKMMSNKLGSVVAIDPRDGGILSFVSAPVYKPNELLGKDRSANFNRIYTDFTKPLYNRAVLAQYSPGSTFKPISAIIGLDLGVITPKFGFPCRGGYYRCGRRIGCTHSGGGHASNLRNAIAHSCNSYFCHVYRLSVDAPQYDGDVKLGQQGWYKYMNDLGFGRKLGIDIPIENAGNTPDTNYFNKKYDGAKWNSCAGTMMGMGQGDLLVTPLQMANAICIIANRGYYYTPHLVKKIDGDSTDAKIEKYQIRNELKHIKNSDFESVGLGMMDVVDHGTARIARIPNIEVCGKTGTVENYTLIGGRKTKLPNHSFFVAFAPRINPKIAVAVIVENSGYGATWAGPIASLMIEKYLTGEISARRKYLQTKMEKTRIIPPILAAVAKEEKIRAIAYDKRRDSIKAAHRDTLYNVLVKPYIK